MRFKSACSVFSPALNTIIAWISKYNYRMSVIFMLFSIVSAFCVSQAAYAEVGDNLVGLKVVITGASPPPDCDTPTSVIKSEIRTIGGDSNLIYVFDIQVTSELETQDPNFDFVSVNCVNYYHSVASGGGCALAPFQATNEVVVRGGGEVILEIDTGDARFNYGVYAEITDVVLKEVIGEKPDLVIDGTEESNEMETGYTLLEIGGDLVPLEAKDILDDVDYTLSVADGSLTNIAIYDDDSGNNQVNLPITWNTGERTFYIGASDYNDEVILKLEQNTSDKCPCDESVPCTLGSKDEVRVITAKVDLSLDIPNYKDSKELYPGYDLLINDSTAIKLKAEMFLGALPLADVILYGNLPDGLKLYEDSACTTPIRLPQIIQSNIQNKDFYLKSVSSFKPTELTLKYQSGQYSFSDKIRVAGTCKNTCSKPCLIGGSNGENNSIDYTIELGTTNYGEKAGTLKIRSNRPSPILSTPAALEEMIHDDVSVTRAGGGISSINTDMHTVDISVINPYQYKIEFKLLDETVTKTIYVFNPDNSPEIYNKLNILEIGSTTKLWMYEWHEVNLEWILKEGSTLNDIRKTTTRKEEWTIEYIERIETVTIQDETNAIVSKHTEKYYSYPWGEELIERVNDPDGVKSTEKWLYYDDIANDGGNYSLLKAYMNGDGYWEHYVYEEGVSSSISYLKTIIPHHDTSQDYSESDIAQLESNNNSIITRVYLIDLADLDNIEEKITETIQFSGGTQQQVHYKIEWSQPITIGQDNFNDIWDISCVTSNPVALYSGIVSDFLNALLADVNYLGHQVTKTRVYPNGGNHAYKPKQVITAGGAMTLYNYDTPNELHTYLGPLKIEIVDNGNPNITLDAIDYGTRTITKKHASGAVVYREVLQIISPEVITTERISFEFVPAFEDEEGVIEDYIDEFGRVERIQYLDGTFTQKSYDCCNLEYEIDVQDVQTFYTYDDSGNISTAQRLTSDTPRQTIVTDIYNYDVIGNLKSKVRKGSDNTEITIETTIYNLDGSIKQRIDAENISTFYTYDRNDSDTYDEKRVYPHNASSGPIHVTWIDRYGRTVRAFTGKLQTGQVDWAGNQPTGSESLVELTRTENDYDYYGRLLKKRAYYDLANSYYYETEYKYDLLGHRIQTIGPTDSCDNNETPIHNITALVYDDSGRVIEQWIGTNAKDATPDDPTGNSAPYNNMKLVVETFYDTNMDRTGANRSYATREKSLLASTSLDYTNIDYLEGYDSGKWTTATRDPDGYGSMIATTQKVEYDLNGRPKETTIYEAGDPNNLLAQSNQYYNSKGQLTEKRVWDLVGIGNHSSTTYDYDTAGRLLKSTEPSGAFIKNLYDPHGRVEATIIATDEGTDPNVVTDDLIIEEVAFVYNDVDKVTLQTVYKRKHDTLDDELGRLSSLSSDDVVITYSATWYDEAHRPICEVDYGDNSGLPLVDFDPSTVSTDETYDDGPPVAYDDHVRMIKYIYDDNGNLRSKIDNNGKETRFYYDDMLRKTHIVENYSDYNPVDNTGTTGDATDDRVTKYIYHSQGNISELIAIDPNADGNLDDNQTTTYEYSDGSEADSVISPVKRAGLLLKSIYPGGDDQEDNIQYTYYANASIRSRKDQRGIEITYQYDELGRQVSQFADSQPITYTGDTRIEKSYDDLGRLELVTTYNDADGTTPTSQVKNIYNGYGNLIKQRQDVDGLLDAGGIDTLDIDYGYGLLEGESSSIIIHEELLTWQSFPHKTTDNNYRKIIFSYGGIEGKSIAMGRIDEITENGNSIVRYDYFGRDFVLGKSYPNSDPILSPILRMTAGSWDETTGTWIDDPYERFDTFGRIKQHAWLVNDTDRLFDIQYKYDGNNNRKYSDRSIYKSYSQFNTYDNLDRLVAYESGPVNHDTTDIKESMQVTQGAWSLDLLGNPKSVDDGGSHNERFKNSFKEANEFDTVEVKTISEIKPQRSIFESAYSHYWEKNDLGDVFTFNSRGYGNDLVITRVSGDDAIVLFGEDIGPAEILSGVYFPIETPLDDYAAGIVFGYKSETDFWLHVYEKESGVKYLRTYHVTDDGNGGLLKTLIESRPSTFLREMTIPLVLKNNSYSSDSVFNYPNGFPSGRVGVYTTFEDMRFTSFSVYNNHVTEDAGVRWVDSSRSDNSLDPSDDNLRLSLSHYTNSPFLPILLRGLQLDRFDVVFSVERDSSSDSSLYFVFNAQDYDNYNAIQLFHSSTPSSPSAYQYYLGKSKTAVSLQSSVNVPQASDADKLWYRITADDANVKVYCKKSSSKPGSNDWDELTDKVMQASIFSFDLQSGMIGFTGDVSSCYVDSLEVKADRDDDGDGVYENSGRIEHIDEFDAGNFGYTPDLEFTYDDAGNLTYDGIYYYTYDVWNRLIKIEKAFRNPNDGDEITKGSTVGQFRYDGLGRRIMKKVTNMVTMDGAFYYYYDDQRPIETRIVRRDSSGDIVALPILKQHVFGAPGSSYVDELVQIAVNQDPENADYDHDGIDDNDENVCERFFYVLQDANYNVIGVTSATGDLVERYEYSPYGQRTTFSHGWIRADLNDDGVVSTLDLDMFGVAYNDNNPAPDDRADMTGNGEVGLADLDAFGSQWGDSLPENDPKVMYPKFHSFRNLDTHGDTQATPLCEFGHQGLIHDEEFMVAGSVGSQLIYNRARTLNPGLGRFMQRDPKNQNIVGGGYHDGMNLYEYVKSNPITNYDPDGLWSNPDRKGNKYAEVLAKNGSNTIQSLADKIALNASEVANWIKLDGNNRLDVVDINGEYQRRTKSEVKSSDYVCPGQRVFVPNVIVVYVSSVSFGEINLTAANMRESARTVASIYKRDGYLVTGWNKGTNSMRTFADAWSTDGIAGVIYGGHGSIFGPVDDKWSGTALKPTDVNPPYKLSLIALFGCNTADLFPPAVYDGGNGRKSFRSYISDKGEFLGFSGYVNLVTMNSRQVNGIGPE